MAPRRHCRLAAILLTVFAAFATLSHATRVTLHIRAATTKPSTSSTTSSASTACSETFNILATNSRSQYADCLTELGVSWSSSKPLPWVFTADANATEICSQVSCRLSVLMAVNLLDGDCTVTSTASTDTPIHVSYQAVKTIDDACGTPSLTILSPSNSTNATPTPTPSATTTLQKQQAESDSLSTPAIVGIALGATVVVILMLLGCRRNGCLGNCCFWAL